MGAKTRKASSGRVISNSLRVLELMMEPILSICEEVHRANEVVEFVDLAARDTGSKGDCWISMVSSKLEGMQGEPL